MQVGFFLTGEWILDIIMAEQPEEMWNLQLFIFEGKDMVDAGLIELVEKILWAVSFMTVGGTLAIMFFLIFAQSILGSKSIHTQIEILIKQKRQICEHLEQIAQHLESDGNRCFRHWCEVWDKDTFDVRIPIILTGPYRHNDDIAKQISSTCLIIETANGFKPTHVPGAFWAYNGEVTGVALSLLGLPTISYLLNTGPLSLA